MSASSGILAKGEKGKSKFQSLDINNLYKSTESEPTQQKGTLLRTKNGMQSLGKVPTARRPPANLPSLKAESSGSEPAVSLVPAGAAGWGSKPGESPAPAQPSNAPAPTGPPPAPVAVVTPVVMVPPAHEQAMHNLMPGGDKSWSAIMAREPVPNFLAHQSPQFQQEFPKLASEGGPGAAAKPGDAQYGPGPSLRPQTEGSWTSGGGRPPPGAGGQIPPSLGQGLPEPGAARAVLAAHAAVGAVMGPAGPLFPHGGTYRPLQHSFMMPRPGVFPPPMAGMRPRYPGPGFVPPSRATEGDEPVTRPIIRDEELNKMDEIARDPGWAANEDIDYNQQLAFSDNEDSHEDSNRKRNDKNRNKEDDKEKVEPERRSEERANEKRGGDWDRSRHRGYPSDEERRKQEDERMKQRDAEEEADRQRRKVREEVAAACQLAHQRKEDEAKRFDESKRGDRRDGREWDERNAKRDTADRDSGHKQNHTYDHKRDNDHKYDQKRENDHKYEPKRDIEHNERGKRDEPRRDSERDRDYRGGRTDDRRDFRLNNRAPFKQLPPRLQAQAERMNSQRSTGSPQPSNQDSIWGHSTHQRRYDNAEDNYPDRYNRHPPHSNHEPEHRRHFDRTTPQPISRESDSEKTSEDGYKITASREAKEERKEPSEPREPWRNTAREDEQRRPQRQDSRENREEPRRPQRPESRENREEPRRPQRPDSRDSRDSREGRDELRRPQRPDSRDSRGSRESREDSRAFPTPVIEDKRREELEMKVANRYTTTPPRDSAPKHGATPPRERQETPEAEVKPTPTATTTVVPPAQLDELKEENEDKNTEESRGKGKSSRGNRWGSTYIRNGTRNEQRRRRVSGGSGWNRPENESGSSGEGGSELEKGEKEERNRETKRSDGFAPRGQPSRRGRGAARVRGAPSSAPRRMDGYGPPPVKASFPQTEMTTPAAPAPAEEEEDRTKQKQAALNAGIAGTAAREARAPRNSGTRMPRVQSTRDPHRPKATRGARRPGAKTAGEGEDVWETMSNSDGEGRENRRTARNNNNNARQPGGTGTARVNRPPATAKEESNKAKSTDGEAETVNTNANNSQEARAKGKVNKGGKPESGHRGAPGTAGGKDRSERQDRQERRAKPQTVQATAPPNPNPTGPQPLMSQVVNPPPTLKNYNSGGGGSTWRNIPVLPPRLQKQQEQQRLHANETQDIHKITNNLFSSKGENIATRENAWEKPLGPPARSPLDQGPSENSSQRSSPGSGTAKLAPLRDPLRDPILDDAAPPVNTIIFENTNLKASAPGGFSHTALPPHRVNKTSNEWKPGEELFGKAELGTDTLTEHSIKSPLYRAPCTEQAIEIDLLNAELEMTEENAKDLKHRLAGTKTLWDQHEDEQPGTAVFPAAAAFCQDTGIDGGFGKTVDGVVPDDCIMHPGEVVYSPAPQPSACYSNTSSNVCKVKPQQQTVLSSGQSPLSPPPFSSTQQGQFTYPQAGLGGSPAQFGGMPAIPSPPAGLPYSSQLQASTGLFPPFHLDRQFSTQFSAASYGLSGLGGTSTFNQPPLYLPHAAPPSDLFSSMGTMSQYRHTNPNTVLLTSSANSLMSASVKPSQSIGVIGSKGPTYQQNSQMFIPLDAMQLNVNQSYIPRQAAVQQPTPNFYSNSQLTTHANPNTAFYASSSPSLAQPSLGQPMASLQQPYARQGFVNQSNTVQHNNLQSYSSQVNQMPHDIGFRHQSNQAPPSYHKSGVTPVNSNSFSPYDVLNSAPPPMIRLPKHAGQPQPQQSPTPPNNKFSNYSNMAPLVSQQQPGNQQRVPQSNMGLQGMRSAPRYPSPIQRPAPYRSRPGPQQQTQRVGQTQDGKLEESSDLNKMEDCESKLAEPSPVVKSDPIDEEPAAGKD